MANHQNHQHEWVVFSKGRMRVTACAHCGNLQLAGNSDSACDHYGVWESQLIKAGYRMAAAPSNRSTKAA